MIVVADSGPLHYFILFDHSELLRRFYNRVVVTTTSFYVDDALVNAVFQRWLRP